jgi:NTE family protein
MPKKTALILSGGGAKGAFQCGAEKYAREARGYQWDIISGVSVGALNALMLSMRKYERLFEIWNTIRPDQVYTGGFNVLSTIKLLFGAKSFYGNAPLQRLIHAEFEPDHIQTDLMLGCVSLITGEYVLFNGRDPDLEKAVLASTVMPVVWTPVDVSARYPSLVDGGIRNISPIGDVLEYEPDEIIIINCQTEIPGTLPGPPPNIMRIGLRAIDLLLNELFLSDLREFLRINSLVNEAAAQGTTLHNPQNGKPLKYYPYQLIQPDSPLNDTLDFSQPSIQRSLRTGMEKARQVLGG